MLDAAWQMFDPAVVAIAAGGTHELVKFAMRLGAMGVLCIFRRTLKTPAARGVRLLSAGKQAIVAAA